MSRIFNRPMFKLGGKPNSDGVGITSGLNRHGYEDGTPSNIEQWNKWKDKALSQMDNMGKVSTPELAIMASNVLGKGGSIYDMITNATEEIMPAYGNYKKVQSQLPEAKAGLFKMGAELDFTKRGLDIKEMAANKPLLPEVKLQMLKDVNTWKEDKIGPDGQWVNPDDFVEYQVRMNIIDSGFLTETEARVKAGEIVKSLVEFEDAGSSKKNRMIKAWVDFLTGRKESVDYRLPEAEGGRVGYAMGMGPVMDQQTEALDIQTPTSNEEIVDTQTEVMQPGGSKDPFVLLRARLPKEITDDVVKLIAYNPEAFKDFAAIESQQDVINFNQTYGVELVIPTSQV